MQNFNKEEEERNISCCSLILRSSFAHPSLMVRLRFVYGRGERAGKTRTGETSGTGGTSGTGETGGTGGTGETGGTSATGGRNEKAVRAVRAGKNGDDW